MEDTAGRAPCAIGLDALCEDLQKATRFDAGQKAAFMTHYWDGLDQESLYLFNRMATGTSSTTLPRETWLSAMADHFNIPTWLLSHRLAQKKWMEAGMEALAAPQKDSHGLPLPFPDTLITHEGPEYNNGAWSLHWQKPGTEVQLVKRSGSVTLWSKDLNILNDQQEQWLRVAEQIPDGTVLYGILIPTDEGPRTSRGRSKKVPGDGSGTAMLVVDIFEWKGLPPKLDHPAQRVNLLRSSIGASTDLPFLYQEELQAKDDLELKALHRRSRLAGAGGLILLPVVPIGPAPQVMLAWPAAPHRIKAVLLYAQRGDGLQGPQYSFALAQGRDWVTIARTGDGLNDDDQEALEKFIKANTLQRFGPVRTVKAVQVMELEVDTIRASTRHKCGYLLEGVRIAAWRKDLGTEMADDVSILNSMRDQ